MKLHASGEDYLEAILILQKQMGESAVRSVDLDRHMGFSKPSISHAKEIEIKREIEKGQAARTCGRYQNVVLSEKDLSELKRELPDLWESYVEWLSEYMASTGKSYKNHAATIRRWANADRKGAAPQARNRDYTVKEGDTI